MTNEQLKEPFKCFLIPHLRLYHWFEGVKSSISIVLDQSAVIHNRSLSRLQGADWLKALHVVTLPCFGHRHTCAHSLLKTDKEQTNCFRQILARFGSRSIEADVTHTINDHIYNNLRVCEE